MIISRTPFRISFVGGGTDLKSFYEIEDGRVVSTSINKFIYVTAKRQLNIAEHKYRISWSKIEFCDRIDDIEHPIVREALRLMKIDYPLEITTFADVPANTGLGSSSAFAVGLLHALFALKGEMVTKNRLATMAAQIEIDILKRNIGAQDHYASAYGNVNVLNFHKNSTVSVEPVFYRADVKSAISRRLMLFYTALKRDASQVLQAQKEKTQEKFGVLHQMRDLTSSIRDVFSGHLEIDDFGRILHAGWVLKRSITDEISNPQIDTYYEKALAAGALGGKLLGAGGGGFLLFYVPEEKQKAVAESLKELYQLKFDFDTGGSRITFYDQTN